MWAPLMTAPNRYVAETLRELLFAEGVSVRFVVSPIARKRAISLR